MLAVEAPIDRAAPSLEYSTTRGHRRRNVEEDCDNHLGQRLDMPRFAIDNTPGKKRS